MRVGSARKARLTVDHVEMVLGANDVQLRPMSEAARDLPIPEGHWVEALLNINTVCRSFSEAFKIKIDCIDRSAFEAASDDTRGALYEFMMQADKVNAAIIKDSDLTDAEREAVMDHLEAVVRRAFVNSHDDRGDAVSMRLRRRADAN
jgi:hypothetical protein